MEWPLMLSGWLIEQGVDPERVSVVLQVGCADDADLLEAGLKNHLDRSFLTPDTLHVQATKYCGLAIEVRRLRSPLTK